MTFKNWTMALKIVLVFTLSIPIVLALQWVLIRFVLPPLDEDGLWAFAAWSNLVWFAVLTIAINALGWIYLARNQWPYFILHLRRHSLLIFLGIFLLIVFNLLSAQFLQAMGLEVGGANQDAIIQMANASLSTRMALLVAAGFLAPFVEEMVFRKSLIDLLSKRFGVVIAIASSSLLFGFLHVILDLSQFYMIIPYVVSGLVLTFIYFFSNKNIFVPIMVHASYNLMGLLILILPLQERFSGI